MCRSNNCSIRNLICKVLQNNEIKLNTYHEALFTELDPFK